MLRLNVNMPEGRAAEQKAKWIQRLTAAAEHPGWSASERAGGEDDAQHL